MKTGIVAVVAAVVASACCIGPAIFSAIGFGTLAAASTGLEGLRPIFLFLTVAVIGTAFYSTYRPRETGCSRGRVCSPEAGRRARLLLWFVAAAAALIAAFPYYAELLF